MITDSMVDYAAWAWTLGLTPKSWVMSNAALRGAIREQLPYTHTSLMVEEQQGVPVYYLFGLRIDVDENQEGFGLKLQEFEGVY